MAKNFKTGLIITGDAGGGVRAVRATSSEIRKLNQDFERGSKRARSFGDQTQETSRDLEFLKQHALGVGTAIAGAFAVNNLGQQAEMIRNTDALAQSLQVSTKILQEWQFAGQSVGLEADKVGDIFKDVSDKVGDFAATGGGEAKDLFEQLNLNIRELQSLSPDKQILRIADAISEVEDPSQRSFYFESLADEMVRLQPLLADGAEGLREAAETADSLGVAMNDIEIQQAVDAAEAIEQLRGVGQGLSNTLIADLGPGLADTTRSLTEFIDEVGGADVVLGAAGKTVTSFATVYLARKLGPGLLAVGKQGLATGSQIAQGFAMATGASGRLNQALVVTQGRIAATAAAGRALRGALALVGGPIGLLIGGAGLLYTFRDELNLTGQRIGLTEQQVSDFQDELADMSNKDMSGSLASLNAELREATLTAAAAREELAKLQQQDDGYSVTGVGNLGDQVGGINALGAAKERLAEIEQKRNMTRIEWWGRLSDQVTKNTTETDKNTESTEDNTKAAEEAAKRAEQFTSSLAALEDRLFPADAAQRDFLQSQILLQSGLLKGEMSIDRYLEAWQRLNTERSREVTDGFMENIDTGGLTKDVEETSDVAKDLGLTFSSAFEDAAIEGEGLRGVLQGVAEDIQRIIIRKSITEPAGDAISGVVDEVNWGDIGSAIGGILGGGGVTVDTSGVSAMGFNTGSFSAGGYTGDGGTHEPAGIVHRGEFVVKKNVVEQPGVLPMLERLNRMPGYAAGGYVGGGSAPIASGDVAVHIHNEGGEQMQVGRREERRGGDGRRELHLWVNRTVDQRIDQRFADGSMDRTMRNNYGARRQSK